MNSVAKRAAILLTRPSAPLGSLNWEWQQWRGIRVKVRNNNLEQALTILQRKMQSSGIERLIKNEQTHHIKNSEKRVLAKKNLERKIRGQDLARKLKAILVKKVRCYRKRDTKEITKGSVKGIEKELFSSQVVSLLLGADVFVEELSVTNRVEYELWFLKCSIFISMRKCLVSNNRNEQNIRRDTCANASTDA